MTYGKIDMRQQIFCKTSSLRKIREIERRADFDFGSTVKGRALEPLHGFFDRLHLPQPVAADQFLGFAEGTIDHGALLAGKFDALALRAGLQDVGAEEYASAHQLLIELPHFGA